MSGTTLPRIAVLDYGIGNLHSAHKALERVGAEARLTADRADIAAADAVVLPGVGAFGACMEAVRRTGLDEVAHEVAASGVPFLGICVGMQLFYERSAESPGVAGLGLLPGEVGWLPDGVKRPQIQWNQIEVRREHPLVAGLDRAWLYFVHSLAPTPSGAGDEVIAVTDYGGDVVSVVANGSVMATQFHPEKSARAGFRLLTNFVGMA
ncbi:MAG: imidazole glycerol phosphate synthase subunit HisH [Acidimicrobiales bacterium]